MTVPWWVRVLMFVPWLALVALSYFVIGGIWTAVYLGVFVLVMRLMMRVVRERAETRKALADGRAEAEAEMRKAAVARAQKSDEATTAAHSDGSD